MGGADSSDKGAKIRLNGTLNVRNFQRIRFSPSNGGASIFRRVVPYNRQPILSNRSCTLILKRGVLLQSKGVLVKLLRSSSPDPAQLELVTCPQSPLSKILYSVPDLDISEHQQEHIIEIHLKL